MTRRRGPNNAKKMAVSSCNGRYYYLGSMHVSAKYPPQDGVSDMKINIIFNRLR